MKRTLMLMTPVYSITIGTGAIFAIIMGVSLLVIIVVLVILIVSLKGKNDYKK